MCSLIIKPPITEKEFQDYYQLRWQLLAKPWKQDFKISQDDKEKVSNHLTAHYKNQLVGVGRLHFNTKSEAQIRYMGVITEYHGNNIGRAIEKGLRKIALKNNANSIILNARENTIPFYERLGYKQIEQAHILFDVIKHTKMKILLR